MPSGLLPAAPIWTWSSREPGRCRLAVTTCSGETNSSSYYYVNQNSGVVEFALLAQNIPDNETFALTRDESYAQGTAFASSRYETFSQKNWKIIRDEQTQYLVVPHERY